MSRKQTTISVLIVICVLIIVCQTFDNKPIELKTDPSSNMTVVFLTCCNRHFTLYATIEHFVAYNEYPINSYIIVIDGPLTNKYRKYVQLFYPVVLVVTGKKVGQVAAIDQAYKMVKTPYVFQVEDDFLMIKSGVITKDIQILQSEPDVLQVYNNVYQNHKFNEDGYPDLTSGTAASQYGFSFNPTVTRMDWYHKLPNGYVGVTKNQSYGVGAGMSQVVLRDYYNKFSKVKSLQLRYFKHIGGGIHLPKNLP